MTDFCKFSIKVFFEKKLENLRNTKRIKLVKSDDAETMSKIQTQSIIAGYMPCGNFDCPASENQTETVTFKKPFSGFCVLDFSNLDR